MSLSRMMLPVLPVALLAGFLAGAPTATAAQSVMAQSAMGQSGMARTPDATGGETFVYPLSKFLTTKGPLRLKDANGAASLYFPLSGRFVPREADISLDFANSIALLPERSVLIVRLNGTTVGQIRLDPQRPRGVSQIVLPPELLKAGYNQLSFVAAQHDMADCEDTEAPELWTEIDTSHSTLTFKGALKDEQPRLSQLGDIFSPGVGGLRELTIVTAPGVTQDIAFKEGALIAEGVGLRTQYEQVAFHHAQQSAPVDGLGDHVLIGTVDDMANFIAQDKLLDAVSGPTLAVEPAPGDPAHLRFYVVGRTPDEVMTAARAFSLLDFPFTDAPLMTVASINPADPGQPLMGINDVQPNMRYVFRDLGFKTVTLRDEGTQTIPLDINMPPDLYGADKATVDLHLTFTYSAGMDSGSTVNLMLNGRFMRTIHLGNPDGDVLHDYLVQLPLRTFMGGLNKLEFEVTMHPMPTGRCMKSGRGNLAFSLRETSSLMMPNVGHFTSQPNLALFSRTGFPYVSPNKITHSAIAVLDPSLMDSAWLLAAKMAQIVKAPLDLDFVSGWPQSYQHALILGAVDSLPPDLFANLDYGLGQLNKVPYSDLQPSKGGQAIGWLGGLYNGLGSKPDAVAHRDGNIAQVSDLGRNTVMLGMESPGRGTYTILTARDIDTLNKGVVNLVQPEFWSQLDGTMALWRDTPESYASVDLGGKYSLGSKNPLLLLRYYVSSSPWGWIVGSLIGVLLLAYAAIAMLTGRSGRTRR